MSYYSDPEDYVPDDDEPSADSIEQILNAVRDLRTIANNLLHDTGLADPDLPPPTPPPPLPINIEVPVRVEVWRYDTLLYQTLAVMRAGGLSIELGREARGPVEVTRISLVWLTN